MLFPLRVGGMRDGTMFSSVCALPSPTSAEDCPLRSARSPGLRHSQTSPEHSRPPFGLAFADRSTTRSVQLFVTEKPAYTEIACNFAAPYAAPIPISAVIREER